MQVAVKCDWCGEEFWKPDYKLTPHNFCSRKCLGNFSNRRVNPDGYALLKDLSGASANMTNLNARLNPTRMTEEVRAKLRNSRLNSGEGKTYSKLYGRHEHRVVAEQILGRKLSPGEVVHHKNGNKRNNSPENLMVFASQADHARYHAEIAQKMKEVPDEVLST